VIFTETRPRGASIIDLEPREDERGPARTFCQREFEDRGMKPCIVQASIAQPTGGHAARRALPACGTSFVACRAAQEPVQIDRLNAAVKPICCRNPHRERDA
jgi:hypothetical protein